MIRYLLLALLCVALPAAGQSVGASIYRDGVLPSGQPLRGQREAGINVRGAAAACVTCHRRSGLGTTEGNIAIPPITGQYLFRQRGKTLDDVDFRYGRASNQSREAYTDATLARAIRDGVGPNGRRLNYLMPRFDLNDAEMAALIGYLKALGSVPVPGVAGDTLHFATIITPDADPVAGKAMLEVMERFIADKNEFIRGGGRTIAPNSNSGVMYRVTRKWQLHAWQLEGPPETWERQLRERLAREPVFAVVSGLGGKNWAPVHRFCEQAAIPCLFPNVDLPVEAEKDFYSLYFSKGVLLEAELLARDIRERWPQGRRIVQIYREGDIGAEAARALHKALGQGSPIANEPLPASGGAGDLQAALARTGADDAVVLWLRSRDIAALPDAVPQAAVFASGVMAGLERAPVPDAWRDAVRMAYPFDLPDRRKARMNYPLGWFRIKHIAVVNERVQADTYLACGIVSEILGEMLDIFERDYLIERIEVMLSHRLVTGYYPRLGLAPGQRFASKGGYIVHLGENGGAKLAAEGGWTIP